MASQHIAFRSKSEREREQSLLKHYREIGIASIAAAAVAMRRPQVSALRAARVEAEGVR